VDITYITVIVSFVFLLLLWFAVGVRHLKLLKKTLDGSWEFVDEKIRKRVDIVPLLIELARRHSGDDRKLTELVDRLIVARDTARLLYFAGGDKTEKEYDLSKAAQTLIKYGKENDAISRDTYFLELKKEFNDLNSDIENRSKEYNETVRKINSHRKIFVLAPLSLVMRIKEALIFEFEK
jgi:hypothetical protein